MCKTPKSPSIPAPLPAAPPPPAEPAASPVIADSQANRESANAANQKYGRRALTIPLITPGGNGINIPT